VKFSFVHKKLNDRIWWQGQTEVYRQFIPPPVCHQDKFIVTKQQQGLGWNKALFYLLDQEIEAPIFRVITDQYI